MKFIHSKLSNLIGQFERTMVQLNHGFEELLLIIIQIPRAVSDNPASCHGLTILYH